MEASTPSSAMRLTISLLITFLTTTTRTETGASNIDLGDPDSGEWMPVDVKVMDPIPGEPPKIQLLKQGETVAYCIAFESIFEATSYDVTTGTYTTVDNSQISLNSVTNDCTLSQHDSNTAIIQCSVDGTLTFTIDSHVQIDSSGIETGAKYSFTLEDYLWKSSDPSAQFVMVHSFATCTTDASSRRRLLSDGAIILEGDSDDDPQEVDYGTSAFDIHGIASDQCAYHSSIIERSLVQQSDKIHIVFDHFQCTLTMDPFFGLENEEYGFTAPTTTAELFAVVEVGNIGMIYVAIIISVLLFFLFVVFGLNQMPSGTCACAKDNKKEDATKQEDKEDDVENQRGQTGDAVVNEEETKGNDVEEAPAEQVEIETQDTEQKQSETNDETVTKREAAAVAEDEAVEEKKEDKETETNANEDTNAVESVKEETESVQKPENGVEETEVVQDEKGNNEEETGDAVVVPVEDTTDDNNKDTEEVQEEKEKEDTATDVNKANTDGLAVKKEAQKVSAGPTTGGRTQAPQGSDTHGVGTPVKVTLERAWMSGAPDDEESDSEETGDVMGDLNSVKLAINMRAQQNLGTITDMETPQSTAL